MQNTLLRLIFTILLLSTNAQAVKLSELSYYYLDGEAGRIAVSSKASTSILPPKNISCLASNGDVVAKLAETTQFSTQLSFIDGNCKGSKGYVHPGFLKRLFIELKVDNQ